MKTIQELGFQNGYDFAESVLNKNHLIDVYCDYAVLIQSSYDGVNWDKDVEFLLTTPDGDYEWLNDWWENQPYVLVGFCISAPNLLEVKIPNKYWPKGLQLNEE
jgi:hypothetical protein